MTEQPKYGQIYHIKRWNKDVLILYVGWYDIGRNPQDVILLRNPNTDIIEALRGHLNGVHEGTNLDSSFTKMSLNENETSLAEEMMQKRKL